MRRSIFVNLYTHRGYIWRNGWIYFRHRYAGTGLGVFWNVVNPLIEVLVYTLVFSQIIVLRSQGSRDSAYVIFLVVGLFPWLAFTEGVLKGAQAITQNRSFLRRLPLPPEVFVAVHAVSSTIGLCIYLTLLEGVLLLNGARLDWSAMLLPVLAVGFQLLAFSIALIFANIQALLPDVGEILGAMMQIWRWTLPILYTEDIFPERWRFLFQLNPPYYFIQSFRQIFLELKPPTWEGWGMMLLWTALFLLLANWVSVRLEVDVKDAL